MLVGKVFKRLLNNLIDLNNYDKFLLIIALLNITIILCLSHINPLFCKKAYKNIFKSGQSKRKLFKTKSRLFIP